MKKHPVYDHLNRKKPSILALIDPDRVLLENACKIAEFVIDQGVDGIMVGSSLLVSSHFEHFIAQIKKGSSKPVIIFPGCSHQIAKKADAIFFLSLLSGRNSEFLIGEYFGMKYTYLEAGSGARMPVPVDMIKKVKKETSISLIVGGGIKTAKTARAIIDAGADIIVLGSIIEKSNSEL